MPIAGLVRFRKHQFGRQAAFGTKVAAAKAYPFQGTPDVELNWTDREADVGSIDIVATPFRTASDLTASLTDPAVEYNSLPLMLSGIFGGAVTPSGAGTAQTWAFAPASETVDNPDLHTYEFGDDVLTDWYQLGDGILETLEITGPEGLGALTASMSWRYGSVASTGSTDAPVTGTVPMAGLTVDPEGVIAYLKDSALFIASSTAGLAAGQVTDALHSFTLRITTEVDHKRYANGQQNFDIQGYARTSRVIEFEAILAKTADTVGTGSESDAWMSDTAVNRYVRLTTTSTAMAEGVIPYSWTFDLPLRYYTRAEGESGGNTTITLMGRAFYDPDDLDGVFTSTVVNTLTDLGSVGS